MNPTRFDEPPAVGDTFTTTGKVESCCESHVWGREHSHMRLDDDGDLRLETILRDLTGRRVKITVEALD